MSQVVYNVKINGVDQMLANLSKIDARIRNDVALEAVQEGAAILQSRAAMNAPFRIGTLRQSFKTESRKTAGGAIAEIGPHVAYDRIQELGGWTGRGHKTRIVGKFYLHRAVEEKKDEISRVMAATVKEHLGE